MAFDVTADFIKWMDEQPSETFMRAEDKAYERDTEWWDEDSYLEVVADELKRLYVDDALTSLVMKGLVEPTPDFGYALTDKGREALDE